MSTADSLLASLCREADANRQRCRQLQHGLRHCGDGHLFERLRAEQHRLQRRRSELQASARRWQRRGGADPLALAFLIELCSRPPTVWPG